MKDLLKFKNFIVLGLTIVMLVLVLTPWFVTTVGSISSTTDGKTVLFGEEDSDAYVVGIAMLLLACFAVAVVLGKDNKMCNLVAAVLFVVVAVALFLTKTLYFKTTLTSEEYEVMEALGALDFISLGYGVIITAILSLINGLLCGFAFLTKKK